MPLTEAEPRRPGGRGSVDTRSWWDRFVDPVRWEPGHERLAAQPVFRACSRSDVRALARAGDECFVPAGTVLCREGRIGYWLFVVMSGGVQLTVDGGRSPVATLRSGSHFGDVAILGFGPQPVTAVVIEDATVFVLGRRSVLDLVHAMAGFRAGLFPGVGVAELPSVVRELREAGTAAWRAMPATAMAELVSRDRVEQLPPTLVALPTWARSPSGGVNGGDGGGGGRGGGGAFAAALPLHPRGSVGGGGTRRVVAPIDRRVVAGLASVLVGAVVAFGLLFHPDVLVVRPSGTIDVSRDVTAPGLGPPSGRYVVTAVDIEETNLVGLAMAAVRGEEIVPRAHGAAAADDDRAGRASYRRSQTVAADLVARRAGLDPATVRFRDRGLVGPSAGLLHALVLADMAGVVDVPRGRVVAATGELTEDGRIRPVGFVEAKHAVARRSGATVFLVPAGLGSKPDGRVRGGTISVATFDDALAAVGS